jgi:hypothetical protein
MLIECDLGDAHGLLKIVGGQRRVDDGKTLLHQVGRLRAARTGFFTVEKKHFHDSRVVHFGARSTGRFGLAAVSLTGFTRPVILMAIALGFSKRLIGRHVRLPLQNPARLPLGRHRL